MSLHEYLNALDSAEASSVLERCCGAEQWVNKMVLARPFDSDASIFSAADLIWSEMRRADILEAFSHHPKIGSSLEALREKFQNTATWSASEQSSVASASEETLTALAQGNIDYELRFGYIFIVCATGKSAREMLDILLSRLSNTAEAELAVAAAEQAKITRIRLEKIT
jgi:2-oxo-4-hydroxy-4-carboxy-5-ureidoimidazoline decarboxylase